MARELCAEKSALERAAEFSHGSGSLWNEARIPGNGLAAGNDGGRRQWTTMGRDELDIPG